MSKKTVAFSVVICTYNRADLLTDVLQTICNQTLDSTDYEVLIVDNNSTDETARISDDFVSAYPNVRYVVETQQGLSHARNRGWQEAKGVYIAYIDDDCKVPTGWLSEANTFVESYNPDVFGGPYAAFYNTPKPAWFKDTYGSHHPYDQTVRLEESPNALHGGNLFIRRDVLEAVGGFNPRLGMSGTNMGYGEETALIRYLQEHMPETSIYFEPTILVYHLVRADKMSIRWLMRHRFINARYVYRVGRIAPPTVGQLLQLFRLGKTSLRFIISVSVEPFFRDRKKYTYFQNYLYEKAFLRLDTLGWLYEEYLHITKNNRKESAKE
ncbi:MAG: glycosyltransferase [Chloroflexota bacterium]